MIYWACTDSPMVGLAAGASIHHELEALHRAGLPISDVLSAATWENARFVDPDGKFGAVRTGWEADLLLVDGDPTVDLASLRAIEMIWTDGRQVTRRGAPAN